MRLRASQRGVWVRVRDLSAVLVRAARLASDRGRQLVGYGAPLALRLSGAGARCCGCRRVGVRVTQRPCGHPGTSTHAKQRAVYGVMGPQLGTQGSGELQRRSAERPKHCTLRLAQEAQEHHRTTALRMLRRAADVEPARHPALALFSINNPLTHSPHPLRAACLLSAVRSVQLGDTSPLSLSYRRQSSLIAHSHLLTLTSSDLSSSSSPSVTMDLDPPFPANAIKDPFGYSGDESSVIFSPHRQHQAAAGRAGRE